MPLNFDLFSVLECIAYSVHCTYMYIMYNVHVRVHNVHPHCIYIYMYIHITTMYSIHCSTTIWDTIIIGTLQYIMCVCALSVAMYMYMQYKYIYFNIPVYVILNLKH